MSDEKTKKTKEVIKAMFLDPEDLNNYNQDEVETAFKGDKICLIGKENFCIG